MDRSQKERIQYIILRFLDGDASPGERMELSALLKTNTDNSEWTELLEEIYSTTPPGEPFDEQKWQPVLDELIHANRQQEGAATSRNKRAVWMLRRIAVAASILLVIGFGSYYLFFNNKEVKQEEVVSIASGKEVKAPETNRATITLTDGKTVYLDSVDNGQLAVQGNVKLVKLANGQIVYETTSSEVLTEIKYNTLSNPRGSKVIDMALADGSHVWLNAGSSVTYPIAFMDNERNVTITGEAYFEVAHDKTKPFRVTKGDMTVEVLGTHFNVNAYDDEEDIKVSLLEGSVKVSGNQHSLIIQPNQQAIVTNNNVSLNKKADMEEVMAWKNGRFVFSNSDLQAIMRQVMRWYDVEVVYAGNMPQRFFTADLSRQTNLSELLKVLEVSKVHFKIENKKLTVLP